MPFVANEDGGYKTEELRVGFIGAGNMAQAIIGSIVKSGLVKAGHITASAPSDRNLALLRRDGVKTTTNNESVIEECDVVFIAVKPHVFSSMPMFTKQAKSSKTSTTLFVSIMAGITLDSLAESVVGYSPCQVIRTMPNTPSLVSEGVCVYAPGERTESSMVTIVERLLSGIGVVQMVPENLINAVAAVAGSGPAYMYMAIEALADGGVKMGIPRALATSLAAQTLRGAATMVLTTGKHPGQLKDEVCSPGGTTIEAVHALEKSGFRGALMDAVEAGTNKAFVIAEKNKTK